MEDAVRSLRPRWRERTAVFSDWPGQRAALHGWAEKALGLPAEEVGSHAGHFETSIMLRLAPGLVDMDAARAGYIGSPEDASRRMAERGMQSVSEAGVVGDPRSSTAEAGDGYLAILVDTVCSFIERDRKR
jgi:creatinine amidohydrolase